MGNPWADTPFELMAVPGIPGAQSCNNAGVMSVAIEMANVHNVILRGLNAIYNQAPHVTSPADITDFLLYITAWSDLVHHHHLTEESIFFPRIEELAREANLAKKLMSSNVDQHHIFEPKMAEMVEWVTSVKKGKQVYDATALKILIDGFAPVLTEHLHDEIDSLIGLEKLDGEKVEKAMADVAETARKTADPAVVIPLFFGCIDRRHPGSDNFPPVPFFVSWLNAFWFARKQKGVWRFNPCDNWGRPRPLQFN